MVRVIERQDRGKNCPAPIFTPRETDVSLGPLGGRGGPSSVDSVQLGRNCQFEPDLSESCSGNAGRFLVNRGRPEAIANLFQKTQRSKKFEISIEIESFDRE